MNRTERLYRIDHLLQQGAAVPVEVLLKELDVSLATFKRDLEYLRSRLNAPIVWDFQERGYRLDRQGVGQKYELPGLWFNASEIYALLTMQQLLRTLEPGLLTPQIEPLATRLRLLLDTSEAPVDAVEKRIQIQRPSARAHQVKHFALIADAVLKRRRLVIEHYNRERGEILAREISPQRLRYHRGTWYLDAWCHLRKALRSFALDAMRSVAVRNVRAREIAQKELQAAFDSGFGIFGGRTVEWAELRFRPERARWVSNEQWHVKQEGWFADDGYYHLKVPYSDPRELVMEILRHVPEVSVISPPSLRQQVLEKLQRALECL